MRNICSICTEEWETLTHTKLPHSRHHLIPQTRSIEQAVLEREYQSTISTGSKYEGNLAVKDSWSFVGTSLSSAAVTCCTKSSGNLFRFSRRCVRCPRNVARSTIILLTGELFGVFSHTRCTVCTCSMLSAPKTSVCKTLLRRCTSSRTSPRKQSSRYFATVRLL